MEEGKGPSGPHYPKLFLWQYDFAQLRNMIFINVPYLHFGPIPPPLWVLAVQTADTAVSVSGCSYSCSE